MKLVKGKFNVWEHIYLYITRIELGLQRSKLLETAPSHEIIPRQGPVNSAKHRDGWLG